MRRLLIPLGLVCASTLVAVLLCEVVLRVIDFSAPIWYRPDPLLGWSLRPGVEGWFKEEGDTYIRINSHGLRDREHSLDKKPGVYRIAVLGDSQAEARQVDQDATFWALLERKLTECTFQPGKQIEVINFGVSGYSTAQEYLQFESIVIDYQPDLLLHLFTLGNDVVNNSFELEPSKERPFFRLDPQGRLTLDRSWVEAAEFKRRSSAAFDLLRILGDHLRLLQLVRSAKYALEARQRVGGTEGNQAGNDPSVMAPPRDHIWEEAWTITELILAKLKELVSRNKIHHMLVIGFTSFQVNPDPRVRRDIERSLGVNDLFYGERRLEKFASAHDLEVLPLAYEMQNLADMEHVYFHGFGNTAVGVGHWNETGHRAVAQILARTLCARPK